MYVHTVCMYTLGWVLLVPTNISNFVSTYIAQLNVSNSSTMKIVYSPCTSSWVLLFILKIIYCITRIFGGHSNLAVWRLV